MKRTLSGDRDSLETLRLNKLEADVGVLNEVNLELGLAIDLGRNLLLSEELHEGDEANTILERGAEVVDFLSSLLEVRVDPVGEGLDKRSIGINRRKKQAVLRPPGHYKQEELTFFWTSSQLCSDISVT